MWPTVLLTDLCFLWNERPLRFSRGRTSLILYHPLLPLDKSSLCWLTGYFLLRPKLVEYDIGLGDMKVNNSVCFLHGKTHKCANDSYL